MEKKCNDSDLLRKGLNTKGEIFFYQRWSELLNYYTIDSYQYNILNSYVALYELFDVIVNILNNLYAIENVKDCIDETCKIIENDDLLSTKCPALVNRLKHHMNGKTINPKDTKDNSGLLRLKYQVDYAIKIIRVDYLLWIINALQNDIIQNDFSKIEKHSSFLISQCVYYGWSSKGLYELRSIFESKGLFNEKWDIFKNLLLSPLKDYLVFYSFESIRPITMEDIVNIKGLGLNVKSGKELIENNSDVENLLSKVGPEKLYINVSIQACDAYSAVFEGLSLINNKMNIAAFYNILEPWLNRKPSIIVLDKTIRRVNSIAIHELFRTYDYIDSSTSIFEKTKNIYANKKHENIQAKLNGVFSYTNLSKISLFQEVKFINLWVALESITRTGQYSSIIEHLKQILPPILCTRYIYRIIRNFAEDCKRCEVVLSSSAFSIDLNQASKGKLVEDIIDVFKTELKYVELHNLCCVNILLQYRCTKIKEMLINNKTITDTLDLHHKKIKWHLQRLYRIRNAITHSAFQSNKSILKYIENLYDYVAILISEIVYYVENKELSSIEEVFTVLVDNYNAFDSLLKENCTLDTETTKTGVINVLFLN